MTDDERQAVVFSTFAAIRRLVPRRHAEDLGHHLLALTGAINDHGDVAYDRGHADALKTAQTAAYEQGRADGMIAIDAQVDRRDLLADDPLLLSTH